MTKIVNGINQLRSNGVDEMFGNNYPPGVTTSMIPGNRPEDDAWESFWKTNVPKDVYEEFVEGDVDSDIDLEELYATDKEYETLIDNAFEDWCDPDNHKPDSED